MKKKKSAVAVVQSETILQQNGHCDDDQVLLEEGNTQKINGHHKNHHSDTKLNIYGDDNNKNFDALAADEKNSRTDCDCGSLCDGAISNKTAPKNNIIELTVSIPEKHQPHTTTENPIFGPNILDSLL
jgi:hypothetical protein